MLAKGAKGVNGKCVPRLHNVWQSIAENLHIPIQEITGSQSENYLKVMITSILKTIQFGVLNLHSNCESIRYYYLGYQ